MSDSWRKKARNNQDLYFDLLGNRRYDFIKYESRQILEDKVSYVLLGPLPKSGYVEEQRMRVKDFTNKIIEKAKSNGDSGVYFMPLFIIGITEEGNQEFVDIVFKLDPKIFVDSIGRVYDSWDDYFSHNKLPKCWYCYPQDGKYEVFSSGEVKLGFDTSPACDLLNRTGEVVDVVSTITTVGAGVVGLVGLFTPLAPLVLIGAGIAGGTGGAYTAARSGYTLYDRVAHDQSINPFTEAAARSAWLDVVFGPLSVAVGIKSVADGMRLARLAKTSKTLADAANVASKTASAAAQGGGEILKSAPITAQEAASFSGKVAQSSQKVAQAGGHLVDEALSVGGKVVQGASGGGQLVSSGVGTVTLLEAPQKVQEARIITLKLVDRASSVAKASKMAQVVEKGINMGLIVAQKSYEVAELASLFVFTQIPKFELMLLDNILAIRQSKGETRDHEISSVRQTLLFFFHIHIERSQAAEVFESVSTEIQEILQVVEDSIVHGRQNEFQGRARERKNSSETLHLRVVETGEQLLDLVLPWIRECACNYKRTQSSGQRASQQNRQSSRQRSSSQRHVEDESWSEHEEGLGEGSDEEPERESSEESEGEETIYELALIEITEELMEIVNGVSGSHQRYIELIQNFADNLRSLSRIREVQVTIHSRTRELLIRVDDSRTIILSPRIREYLRVSGILEGYGHDTTEDCAREDLHTPAIYTMKCSLCEATYTGKSQVSALSRRASHMNRFHNDDHLELTRHQTGHGRSNSAFSEMFSTHIMYYFDSETQLYREVRPVELFFQWLLKSRKKDGGLSRR